MRARWLATPLLRLSFERERESAYHTPPSQSSLSLPPLTLPLFPLGHLTSEEAKGSRKATHTIPYGLELWKDILGIDFVLKQLCLESIVTLGFPVKVTHCTGRFEFVPRNTKYSKGLTPKAMNIIESGVTSGFVDGYLFNHRVTLSFELCEF